jgi:transcription termination/antitermination protein NusA
VGSCVGVRGSRVQAVIAELQGEKIDIIQWSADAATFLVNALAPAEVTKVVIDEENGRIEAVVPDDQLSLAIGRRGQNVRLASQLVGWQIDVMTENDESTRRTEDFNRVSSVFIEALNIEEIIAHLLVSEGFSSVEEIAFVDPQELAEVEGFDEGVVAELQARANEYLQLQKERVEEAFKEYGVHDDLVKFDELKPEVIVSLAKKGIKTLDDFAGLSRDEFVEIVLDSGLNNHQIDALIMKAREACFKSSEGVVGKEEV